MQIIKLSAMAATVFAASLLTPQMTAAATDLHQAGNGWDAFNSNSGERLPNYEHAYMGTSMQSAPGQGWDVFHTGAEGTVSVATRYEGTSMKASSGEGWDVFHSGIGDPL